MTPLGAGREATSRPRSTGPRGPWCTAKAARSLRRSWSGCSLRPAQACRRQSHKPTRTMLLCLDVGNSTIYGGVFAEDGLRVQFRKSTHPLGSSDELGVFILSVLDANGVDPERVERVAIGSVVPAALHPLRGACLKYFDCEPFILQAG